MSYKNVDGNDVDGNGRAIPEIGRMIDGKKPAQAERPMRDESKRQVVTEADILAINCIKCHSWPGVVCKDKYRHGLIGELGSTEMRFHRERIFDAYQEKLREKFEGTTFGLMEKAMVIYYAFVMMAQSVAVHSKSMMGQEMDVETIERFFATKAVEELRQDKMLG